MKHFFLIIILTINYLGNCQIIKKTKNETQSKSMIQQKEKIVQNLYEGIWAVNKDENAFFIIKGNTIINIDDRKHPFPFKIRKNVMIVNYGSGSLGKYIVLKISNDSLIIRNEDNSITKLYKRNKKEL